MLLDIPASDNLAEPVMASFRTIGCPQRVQEIRLWRDGEWRWYAVTGWSESGPVPAWIQPIEESGDGTACLVYGGPLGLRLAPAPVARWRLDDPAQWGEGFLLVTPDCAWR
ncbi:MAG: hypothetical protein RMM29_07490 [Planctomycetota bacterium]|nr:hypothetical protein [Planctomycetota bacterium]MCX8040323.1 hypothetical protein [Planctomycetota bacterium]MDW8373471.1 hypothetical protein [Planctomycetota bacterium]